MVADTDAPPCRVVIEPLSPNVDAILFCGCLWIDPRCAIGKEMGRVLAWARGRLELGAQEACLWAEKPQMD